MIDRDIVEAERLLEEFHPAPVGHIAEHSTAEVLADDRIRRNLRDIVADGLRFRAGKETRLRSTEALSAIRRVIDHAPR